jgi:hypothetical protein
MNKVTLLTMVAALAGSPTAPAVAQESNVVPTLVSFSGTFTDLDHKPLPGIVGVTFCIYRDQQGGAPLWMETQNVQLDKDGKYAVRLGSTKSHGLPADLFATGEARWLGVQAQGQPEQPRVMLLSVPYALKAADAQTVGGLPPSAFVLAAPRASTSSITYSQADSAMLTSSPTGTGTTNYVPLWTSSTNLGNSILFQGSGYINIGGALRFPALGTATTSASYGSQPLDLFASVYNSSVGQPVPQHFRWEAEPVSNNTSSASGKVDLLYGSGTAIPTETGLSINSKGILTFAPGQTLSGVAGNETFSGNVSASQLISTVAQGTAPLKLTSTTQVANLNANYLGGIAATGFAKIGANTFTGNQAIMGGNLGIGTTSPQGPLQIINPNVTVSNQLIFGKANLFLFPNEGILFTNTYWSNNGAAGFAWLYGYDDGNQGGGLLFGTTTDNGGPLGQPSERMRIDNAGRVGIGTSFPAQLLEVNGNAQVDGLLAVGTTESNCNTINGLPAICAQSNKQQGPAILGLGDDTHDGGEFHGGGGSAAILAYNDAGATAGEFIGIVNVGGDVNIGGTLTASVKNFKIDHPLAPADKYLVHASVESSEMMNIYTGNVTTDREGEATVQLPAWFEVLNTDFRYQLTVIGQFAQAIVAHKIENNQFVIKTNAPDVEVSWQITGVRQDAYAKAHPLVVEEGKDVTLQGYYIHPELYGAPDDHQIEWAHHPQEMKRILERRKAQAAQQGDVRLQAAGDKNR